MEDKFIHSISALVRKYPSAFFDSITIAQACLESDYGRSDLAVKANNLFGFKADETWQGSTYGKDSLEEEYGRKVSRYSRFRRYDSIEDSIKDHAGMMERTSYHKRIYDRAINANSPLEQAKALTGTYATDSQYGAKLLRIIEKFNLTQYDQERSDTMFPKPKMIDRRTRALGYGKSRGIYANRGLQAITTVVWHYTATLHQGDGENVIKAHERYWRDHHGWEIGGYHYYISRDGTIYWNYNLEDGTYGAGIGNPYCVHISCEASTAWNYTPAQIKSREALTLWLLSNPDLPNCRVMKGHKEIPGNSTTCPGYTIAQLNQFRHNLDVKLRAGAFNANPQGLTEIKVEKYTQPKLPFKRFEVGDTVTLDKGFRWYDEANKKLLVSKREDELTGTQDKIVAVRDIEDVNNSEIAYKLEKYNSWILEEYLVEAKEDWKPIKETEQALKEGQFIWQGKLYQIEEVK